MILSDLFSYLIRKLDTRPVSLRNLVSMSAHHAQQPDRPEPKVSIIIPTKNKGELLKKCISSIRGNTTYKNFELIVVDNQSTEPESLSYFEELTKSGVRVIQYPEKFNYSKICNAASEVATGEFLCFLNNDTEVLSSNWLGSMVAHAKNPSVGLVGAILKYPNGTIQHMGVALGYTGVAGHPGRGQLPTQCLPSECFQVSAITFACAVMSREKFRLLGGLDPMFPVAFNDVDISIRSTGLGLVNLICKDAILLHAESQTRHKTVSLGGVVRGVQDVLRLLKTHRNSLFDRFFAK
jgi:O-antigen biosynthesis protein